MTDRRPPLLAAAAWLGALCGLGLLPGSWAVVLVAVGVLGLVALRLRRWWWTGLATACLGVSAVAGLHLVAGSSPPLVDLARQRATAVLDVVLGPGRATESAHGTWWWAMGRAQRVEARGQAWEVGHQVRLQASGDLAEDPVLQRPGTLVRIQVRLSQGEPGEPVSARATVLAAPLVLAPPSAGDEAIEGLRSGLRRSATVLAPEPAALLPALIVGDTSGVEADTQQRFRVAGLTHLMAVSGANLSLMLATLLWAGAGLGLRGWWLRALAAVGVVGFVALCHAEPSVVRAAAMGTVGLVAFGWADGAQGLRYLSWAVIGLLLLDPWLACSAGFALSVAATGGIVVVGRQWAAAMATWLPRGLAEGLAVPLAAQLATQPLVTVLTGQISLVGIAANLMAGPLVGPATVLGLGALVAEPLAPWLASSLAWLAGWFVQALCWVARLAEAAPSPVLSWPAGTYSAVVLAAGCGLSLLVLRPILARPLLVLSSVAALIAWVLSPTPVPGWPPSSWQVVACDVGQGSATVIRAGPASAVVVDLGPEPRSLDSCLAGLGVRRIAVLVITHEHADHVGGLSGLGSRPVGVVVARPEWVLASGLRAGQTISAAPGTTVRAQDALVEVVSGTSGSAAVEGQQESSAENNASTVVRVSGGGMRVLVAGDLEEDGQRAVVSTAADLAADVLIVPHHGSASQSEDFLAAVGARIALISAGLDNDYGHPAPWTLNRLAVSGAETRRTDTQGSLAVGWSGGALLVTTERQG